MVGGAGQSVAFAYERPSLPQLEMGREAALDAGQPHKSQHRHANRSSQSVAAFFFLLEISKDEGK